MSEQDANATASVETTEPGAAVEAEATEAEPTTGDDSELARVQLTLKKVRSEKLAEADKRRKAEEKAATADQLKTENDTLRAQIARQKVGSQLGLPQSFVDALQGSTDDELIAHAEKLIADAAALAAPKSPPKSTRPVESLQPGSGKAPEATIDDQIAAAEKAGDWKSSIALKSAALAAAAHQ